jgi:hypothetical protein
VPFAFGDVQVNPGQYFASVQCLNDLHGSPVTKRPACRRELR